MLVKTVIRDAVEGLSLSNNGRAYSASIRLRTNSLARVSDS